MYSIYIIPLLIVLILPSKLRAHSLKKKEYKTNLLADNKKSKFDRKKKKKTSKNAAGGIVSVNYFGFGLGANYNYRIIKKLDLGVTFLYSSANLKGEQDNVTEKYDFSTITTSIGARYFVFMNFYAGINLAYSSMSGDYGYSGDKLDSSQTIAAFDSSLIHVDFLIGTKWKIFKRFYIGADWVGYGVNISSSSTSAGDESYQTIIEGLSGLSAEERINSEISSQLQPFYLVFQAGVYF